MVSVPVLSVHRMSMAPRFWIELSRLTMTRLRDMARAPLDRQTDTIIGSISGVRPTATARANRNASFQSRSARKLPNRSSAGGVAGDRACLPDRFRVPARSSDVIISSGRRRLCGVFVKALMKNTSGTMTIMKRIMSQVKLADAAVEAGRRRLIDDGPGHAAEIGGHAGGHDDGAGRAAFDAGARGSRRSSVPAASGPQSLRGRRTSRRETIRRSWLAWVMNRSLQEMSADVGRHHVPGREFDDVAGHQLADRLFLGLPSRSTVARTLIMARSLAAALSARASCTKRSTTPRTTMSSITMPRSESRRSANETAASTSSRITSGLTNGLDQQLQVGMPFLAGHDVGAVLLQTPRRFLGERPILEVSSFCKTSSGSLWAASMSCSET